MVAHFILLRVEISSFDIFKLRFRSIFGNFKPAAALARAVVDSPCQVLSLVDSVGCDPRRALHCAAPPADHPPTRVRAAPLSSRALVGGVRSNPTREPSPQVIARIFATRVQ